MMVSVLRLITIINLNGPLGPREQIMTRMDDNHKAERYFIMAEYIAIAIGALIYLISKVAPWI